MKTDQNSTFGKTTKTRLDRYSSSSKKWQEFCYDKRDIVIKEFIASFETEEDQVSLENWYNHYVYVNDPNCWSRNTPSVLQAEKMRIYQNKKVANGTHHFLGGEISKKTNAERLANGTHNFLGGEISKKSNAERLANGTHNLLGGESNRNRVANGTHNFLGENNPNKSPENRKRIGEHFSNCVWINNGVINKRLPKNDAIVLLNQGWIKGKKHRNKNEYCR